MSRLVTIVLVITSIVAIIFYFVYEQRYDKNASTTIEVVYNNGDVETLTIQAHPEYIYLRDNGSIVYRKYNIDAVLIYTTYVRKYRVLHTNKKLN